MSEFTSQISQDTRPRSHGHFQNLFESVDNSTEKSSMNEFLQTCARDLMAIFKIYTKVLTTVLRRLVWDEFSCLFWLHAQAAFLAKFVVQLARGPWHADLKSRKLGCPLSGCTDKARASQQAASRTSSRSSRGLTCGAHSVPRTCSPLSASIAEGTQVKLDGRGQMAAVSAVSAAT